MTQHHTTPTKSTVVYDTEGASGGHTWSDRAADPQELPADPTLRASERALWANPHHLRHLRVDRGARSPTIRRAGIVWDGYCYGLPVRANGKLMNYVEYRPWIPSGHEGWPRRYTAATGWLAALYPSLPPSGPLLLVAGMFCALIGRQNDLPTVSTTCGAVLPYHLLPRFAGRRVAVLYDLGEEREAQATVEKLRRVASEVWSVEYPSFDGKDLNDWFLAGHTRAELIALIREAR